MYLSSSTLTGPTSRSTCGRSPSWTACPTMFAPSRLQEAHALAADRDVVDLEALAAPFLVRGEDQAQHVGVEAAAEALVGGDDDRADALHVLAPGEERVLVLGVRLGDVHRDLQRALDVGARGAHPVLGLLHLGGRDHLHRLRDLARALHALDLVRISFDRPCSALVVRAAAMSQSVSTRRSS